jgi:glutamine amidotransferase
MCLAIYKPADTAPDWVAYKNGIDSNPDGWGFAVIDNGELLTACGMGGFDEFRHNLEPFSHCQAIIHFRWATHGTKDTTNCHPFFVDDLAVIHNGIVNISTKSDETKSDTWHFVDAVLTPMYHRDRDFFLRSEVIYTQELAHNTSKFVFLRADGKHSIWNYNDCITEKDGHWYSNSAYLSSRNWYAARPSLTVTATATASTHVQESGRAWAMLDEDEREYQRYVNEERDDRDIPADEHEQEYTLALMEELLRYGFHEKTLKDVDDLLGLSGIEALHDLI